ncbi:Short-chain dehydrogenase/reductase [Trema orientale]|uniref:Short-chain dehydrogenase/reductase n=1 Tax=Trema orientale TaxID=63057 RepID=A0A2P5EZ55_TREOI|nr:Short-chain dehydrogenase/reductase [Trema orientale]
MGTNFESAYHICQLAHPLLKASANGSIVFNSSVAGLMALPYNSIYAASKGKSYRPLSTVRQNIDRITPSRILI